MQSNTQEISRPLVESDIDLILNNIRNSISGKADRAFIFGSVARRNFSADSDIDILIVKKTSEKFVRRAFEFEFLFDFYPRLDILVYTPQEFAEQMEKNTAFWEEFRKDAIPLF